MKPHIKDLSLFTGVGGFDLGFDRAGMKCIGQSEIDKYCLMVLRYHYPNIKRYGNIENVETKEIGSVDVVCGGFPCQDLSVAGKRKGLAGSRSGLFFEFARIVSELKPRWFVLENVPGLLSSNEGRDLLTILRWLEKCGYLQAWRVFDSQYFGVAQRRRRVFIVGSLGNGSCCEVLFESESLCRNPAESRKTEKGTAHDIANCLAGSGRGVERAGESRGQDPVIAVPDIAWALQERDCKDVDSDTKEGHLIVSATETGQSFWSEGKPRLRVSTAPSQPQSIITFHTRQDPCSSDKAYALESSIPQANAICYENMAVRRLTPRECERLQGFPDDWTRYGIDENGKKVEISDTQRYKMMGNAVTVNVIEWIGNRIMQLYGKS